MSRPASEVAYLSRALKAPRIRETASLLAQRAREEGWDYEGYLAAVLAEEVSAREEHGGENRVRAARFPQIKTLDDFDFSFQRSIKRETISHLAQLDFFAREEEHRLSGTTGDGENTSFHRLGRPGRPAGLPRPPCHRSGVGGQTGGCQASGKAGRRARAPEAHSPSGGGRGGIYPL